MNDLFKMARELAARAPIDPVERYLLRPGMIERVQARAEKIRELAMLEEERKRDLAERERVVLPSAPRKPMPAQYASRKPGAGGFAGSIVRDRERRDHAAAADAQYRRERRWDSELQPELDRLGADHG